MPSLALLAFGLLMNVVYFSHSSIVAEIGFNPTLNQFLMNVSELACLPLILFLYSRLARKAGSIVFISLAAALSLASTFIRVPANCEECGAVFLQMGLAMLTRSSLISCISLNEMMLGEFYPTSINELATGTFGLGLRPWQLGGRGLVHRLERVQHQPYLLITLLLLTIGLALLFAPETLGKEPQDQIEEIRQLEEAESE